MSPSRSPHSVPTGSASLSDSALDPGSLTELVRDLACDCDSTAEEIVLETSRRLRAWLDALPTSARDEAGCEIESGLADWNDAHGWRGPCATWMDSLRRAWHAGVAVSNRRAALRPSDVLGEELGLWLGAAPGRARSADLWNGEPLSEGARIPSRAELARHAAASLEHGEVVLVSGFSATISAALESAQHAGREPHAIVSESAPRRDGRRMAERLARAGISVTLCCDAALFANVSRADRVWLATEAIGSGCWFGRLGVRHLIDEAERMEVPVSLLAISDKLMPGGELRAPSRNHERSAWPDAP